MPSKWQRLKELKNEDGSPRFKRRIGDPGDSSFTAKVNLARLDLEGLDARGLAAQLLMLEDKKDLLESWVKELNVQIAALNSLILERWENQGVTSTRLESGALLHERIEPLSTIWDPEAWQQYLDEHPELDYLYSVNHQARNSFVKGLLDENKDAEVPQCLGVDLKVTVGIRRS